MLLSIAMVLVLGYVLSRVFERLHLPGLIGMLLLGIVIGPNMLDLLDGDLLTISGALRQMALVIILIRAGLSLDLSQLKKVGASALMLCFVPATFEIIAIVLMGPLLLHISVRDALIMGAVLAAVSPAVIVPRMLRLMEQGYGTKQGIPQMILIGASADDVFVIVLFTSFVSAPQNEAISLLSLAQVSIAVLLGLGLGFLMGWLLNAILRHIKLEQLIQTLLVLCAAFLMVTAEDLLKAVMPVSGLIAVMMMANGIYRKDSDMAKRLSRQFNSLWRVAEIFLFVLVGVLVDVR